MNCKDIEKYHSSSMLRLRAIKDKKIISQDAHDKLLRCISVIPNLKRTRLQKNDFQMSVSQEDPIKLILKEHHVLSSIEISMDIKGKIEIEKPVVYEEYNILVRLLSDKKNISYREKLDSIQVGDKFKEEGCTRIIAQYHFDIKEPDANEPFFHLHFGGKHTLDEMCWYPSNIEEPRFPYPPMDIMLLMEFILQNYYPKESNGLRQTPEWKVIIKKSQNIFQKYYFEKCIEFLEKDSSTLMQCSLEYNRQIKDN